MTKIALVANTDWYLYHFRLPLARHLREQGFQVVLISPGGEFAARITEAGFRFIPWRVGRQSLAPWGELNAVLRLAAIYRRERPDLLHHHTIKPVLYGSFAAQRLRIPCLVNSITGRGYVFSNGGRKARLILPEVRLMYRLALGHPSAWTLFENDADRQHFIAEGLVPAERTCLVQGVGVDPVCFAPSPEPPGRPLIVLPGRMLWDKGVGELVEAARLLRRRPNPPRVALVGDPDPGNPRSIPVETLRGWHEEGVVEWWGFRADMPAVYRQAHVVTLPSHGEGIPTALLEAAACGKPIVSTDAPGTRDVVLHGRNGILVPLRDPHALAEALSRLVEDAGLRARLGAEGRQRILAGFTTEQVNTRTLALYAQLLGGASSLAAGG